MRTGPFLIMIIFSSFLFALIPSRKTHQYTMTQYSKKEGLPLNFVHQITQTPDGFIWMGTSAGLIRFDGARFKTFDHLNTPEFLSSNVTALYTDPSGTLWVGTDSGMVTYGSGSWKRFADADKFSGGYVRTVLKTGGFVWIGTDRGLFLYSEKDSSFTRYTKRDHLLNDMITALDEDFEGNILIGTINGLSILKGGTFSGYHISGELEGIKINSFHRDADKNIWICTTENGIKLYNNGSFIDRMNKETVFSLLKDRDGNLWAGIDGAGYTRLDEGFRPYGGTLPLTSPQKIFEDREGNIWFGSDEGAVLLEDGTIAMITTQDGLPDNQVTGITEDSHYTLWISTARSGIAALDDTPRYFSEQNKLLATNMISSIFAAGERIWAASWNGGLYLIENDHVRIFTTADGFSDNSFRTVLEDSRKRLWAGVNGHGINVLQEDGSVMMYNSQNGLADNNVNAIFERKNGDIVIGTKKGLTLFRDGSIIPFTSNLNASEITSIHEDGDRNLWIGTRGDGIVLEHEGKLHSMTKESGLPDSMIHGILEDDKGNLWISSSFTIFTVPRSEMISYAEGKSGKLKPTIYDVHDGLSGNETMGGLQTSFFKSASGTLYFATPSGAAMIVPSLIRKNIVPPGVHIENFEVDNKPEDIKQNITLIPSSDRISFTFGSVTFKTGGRTTFSYMLEGYDTEWYETGNRTIYYTNLSPGSYRFRVKAANSDGTWSNGDASLSFVKKPWFYQTVWFYILCTITGITIIFLYIRHREKHLKARQRELEALDRMKDEFVANTSHELRTPLNGIIGLAESLIEKSSGAPEKEVIYGLNTIMDSGKRLSVLVNDILDLSALKHGSLSIALKPLNIEEIITSAVSILTPLLKGKTVVVSTEIPKNIPAVLADENRLFQIIYNLLGNAIKFTREGSITISASEKGGFVEISVKDTGIGIPQDKQKTVFNAFEQGDASSSRAYGGTGLGLYITKQLVHLHKGEIGFTSEAGKGSCFTFSIPSTDKKPEKMAHITTIPPETTEYYSPLPQNGSYTILAVDDDPLNQTVIASQLDSGDYSIIPFMNGKDCLDYLSSGNEAPDLILLDVMMPEMNGYDVCRKIRETYSSAELPVIMLTALNRKKDIAEGFSAGANDFVSKPFSGKELQARIDAHLTIKSSVDFFLHEMQTNIVEQEEAYSDYRLDDERVLEICERITHIMKDKKPYLDPDLKFEDLRKLIRIPQKDVSQAIRRKHGMTLPLYISMFRIEDAAEKIILPEYRDVTVLELAYESGFNNKATFNSAFRKFKGVTPKQYQMEYKKW